MRTAEEIVKLNYFFNQKEDFGTAFTSIVLLAAFFGKLIKFKKSTRETTVAPINPFKLLSLATRWTDSHASRWLLSSVNHQTTLLK